MANEKVRETILDLLEDICGDEIVREEMDIDLFEEGLIDSIAAIELLVAIESSLGVAIATTELKREEMDTPAKIIDAPIFASPSPPRMCPMTLSQNRTIW